MGEKPRGMWERLVREETREWFGMNMNLGAALTWVTVCIRW